LIQQPWVLVRVENIDDQNALIYSRFWHFFLRMRINAVTCTSGPNSVVTVVLSDIDFYQCSEILAIWPRFCWLWPNFYGACAETPISELPATILTTPLDSATSISYESRKFRQLENICSRLEAFFFAHAQNRRYLCFRSEIGYHRRSQRRRFLIKGGEAILVIDNVSDNFSHIYCACAQTALSELPATIMTTPLDSATPISHKRGIFRQWEYVFNSVFLSFCLKSAIFLLPVSLT